MLMTTTLTHVPLAISNPWLMATWIGIAVLMFTFVIATTVYVQLNRYAKRKPRVKPISSERAQEILDLRTQRNTCSLIIDQCRYIHLDFFLAIENELNRVSSLREINLWNIDRALRVSYDNRKQNVLRKLKSVKKGRDETR